MTRHEFELRRRLREAMNFIEEWSEWWSHALSLDDSKVTPEKEAQGGVKAASLGKRGARMVVDNRRFLNADEPDLRDTAGMPAALLQEACDIALAISGHFAPDAPLTDPWLANHERRLRELEKLARALPPTSH